MKKIARKIIHYIGVAVKAPFLALFCSLYTVVYLLQLVSVAVRMVFNEPNVKSPIASLIIGLRLIADDLEERFDIADS